MEALDFSELVSVTDEELEHYHNKAEEHPALLPLGTTIHMEGRAFRVDTVNYDRASVTLQDVALAEMRMPVFRQEPLAVVRELYEQEQDIPQLSDEKLDELPISTVMNGKVQTFPDAAALDEALNAEPAPELAGNFHITDEHLGEGGAKQKYARNIEAIRTLFQLEQEHRGATAEEQQVLSQYVGWGGLSDAFDPDKGNWAKEYTELKGLLSEDEYAAARSSTLNAHYTSPTVIRGIYDAWSAWASTAATSWSRPWVWATFSGCCRTAWQIVGCTA